MADEPNKGIAWALLGAGIAALIAAEKDEANRTAWRAAGLALGVAGAMRFAGASLSDLLARPGELLSGAWDRFRGAPAPAAIGPAEHEIPRPPPPGTPTLSPDVRGPIGQVRFLDPPDGGVLDLAPWTQSYRATLELANATSDDLIEGTVELDVSETPFFGRAGAFTVLGPRVRLEPRRKRTVEISIPTQYPYSPRVTVNVQVRVAGHWLGSAEWTLE